MRVSRYVASTHSCFSYDDVSPPICFSLLASSDEGFARGSIVLLDPDDALCPPEPETGPPAQASAVVTSLVPALHFSKRRGRAVQVSTANDSTLAGAERSEFAPMAEGGDPVPSSRFVPTHALEAGANAAPLRYADDMQSMLESFVRHGEETVAVLARYAAIMRDERRAVQRLKVRDGEATEVELLRASAQGSTHMPDVVTHEQQQQQITIWGTQSSLEHASIVADAAAAQVEAGLRQRDLIEAQLVTQLERNAATNERQKISVRAFLLPPSGRIIDAGVLKAQLEAAEAHAAAEHARAASADEINKIRSSALQAQISVMKAQVKRYSEDCR